jgi:hypothetical protein
MTQALRKVYAGAAAASWIRRSETDGSALAL